jgi:hypothetical protein
VTAHFS